MKDETKQLCLSLLSEFDLIGLATVNANGEVLERIGDFEKLASGDLYSGLLGPRGDPKVTFESLEGQMLPRIWRQGAEYAFLHKSASGLMVVVFGAGLSDAIEEYKKSKRVDERVLQVLGA